MGHHLVPPRFHQKPPIHRARTPPRPGVQLDALAPHALHEGLAHQKVAHRHLDFFFFGGEPSKNSWKKWENKQTHKEKLVFVMFCRCEIDGKNMIFAQLGKVMASK